MTAKISKRNKNLALSTFCRDTFQQLPRTQTSLSLCRWKCARKGRREGDNERDFAFPWSLAVHHLSLASTLRKTKRLRRRRLFQQAIVGKQSGRYKTQVTGHRCRLESSYGNSTTLKVSLTLITIRNRNCFCQLFTNGAVICISELWLVTCILYTCQKQKNRSLCSWKSVSFARWQFSQIKSIRPVCSFSLRKGISIERQWLHMWNPRLTKITYRRSSFSML